MEKLDWEILWKNFRIEVGHAEALREGEGL
jgi:hypothetical protein